MSPSLQQFSDALVLEMHELQKLGVPVPQKAIDMAKDVQIVSEYEHMRSSECVDLLISLSGI